MYNVPPNHVRFYDDGPDCPQSPERQAAEQAYREAFLTAAREAARWDKVDEAAIQKAQTLLEIIEGEKGSYHPGVASSLDVLGGLYISMGDCDKALPILKRALEIYDKTGGDNRSNAATNLGLIAKLYCKTNNLHRAKE